MSIILAESTAALLERMARDLAACRDPWARHWLVLPGSGRSEWLQRRWARIAGVAAHSQIVPLRSLIEQAASPEGEPFSYDRLVFAIAQALPSMAHLMPLPKNIDCAVLDTRTLAWSRQIADAIDMGLLCREGSNRWGASFLGKMVEHPLVQPALSGYLGMLDRRAFRAAAERWIAGWNERGGVPRLWIQLDAGLQSVLVRCLADLVDLLPQQVHLSLLSPSRDFWGDLVTRRRWTDGEKAGPVLSCLGQQAQDLHNQAIDHFVSEGSGGEDLPAADPKDSLLGRLQQACHDAAAPKVLDSIRDDDWSFTVHSCRTALRELEICRDRILQSMQEDPTLVTDDILVLLANPSEHAPLVGAALAPLPVRVLGIGGAVQSPVASGFLRLLKTLSGRLGLPDLQALIEEPLIAERFGFSGAGPDLVDWLEQARFRWGLDEGQRSQLQGPGEHRWNLAFALRRLGLGAVVSGELRDGVVDGSAPLERAAGLSTTLLAQLAQFAAALYEARKAWMGKDADAERGTAKPLGQWCALLIDWCNQFLGGGDGVVSEHRTQLIDNIIPSLGQAAPEGLLVRSDALLRLLESSLGVLSSTYGSAGGGITVADLRHYAGTPARLVVIAGLSAETFPCQQDRPGWHPLAASREPGDPDLRQADRHALLLALLACGERLVLTYQGGSDEDAKERPPSTPLGDLLAAADGVATHPNGKSVSQNILIRHGLNGFSPAACADETRAVARSVLPSDYAGAAALLETTGKPYPGLWSRCLPPPERPLPLTLWDLRNLVKEPCRIFVRRLGLRLPEEVQEPSEEDALALDSLQRWSLRDQILQARLTAAGVPSLRERLQAAGELPRALYGDEIWTTIEGELPGIDESGLQPMADNVRLQIGDRVIDSTLPAGWYRKTDGGVVYCTASVKSSQRLLQVKIGLLCLRLTEGVDQVAAWFGKAKKPLVLAAPNRERATALLANLCRLYQLAECLPLPFWPQAYEELRKLEDRTKKDSTISSSPEQRLLQAWSVWTEGTGLGNAGPVDSCLPATRACFRGLDNPFIWAPTLPDDWLPQPDLPLAWRLFCFVSQWEDAAGGVS